MDDMGEPGSPELGHVAGAATDPQRAPRALPAERSARRWWTACVVIAAVLPYLSAFGNEFVRDDLVIIRDNERIRSWAGVVECFASNYWGDAVQAMLYRPLVLATYAANYAVGGLDTAGYTAVNVALHAACCLALLALLRHAGASAFTSGAAAVLFAVHPVHTESVTGFVGRADVLSTLLLLLALLAHRHAQCLPAGRGRYGVRIGAALAFLAALLSKESAIALLGIAPAMDVLLPVRAAGPAPGRPPGRIARYVPLVVAAVVYLGLRYAVLGGLTRDPAGIDPAFNPLVPARETALGTLRGALPGQALPSAIAVVGEYARLLIWPARLSAGYAFEQLPLVTALSDGRFLWGALVVALHLLGALVLARRAAWVAFGLALTTIAFAPTSNIFFPIGTLCAERLMYLPSAGFVIVCGAGLGALARRGADGVALRAAVALLAVVSLAGAVRTYERNHDWRDGRTLWTSAVQAAPRSFKNHASLGFTLVREVENRGGVDADPQARPMLRRALFHLEHAASIWPEQLDVNRAIAAVCWALDASDRLLPDVYARLVRLEPEPAESHAHWAGALLASVARATPAQRTERLTRARQQLDTALELDPASADAHYYAGVLWRDHLGDALRGARHWTEALQLAPDHWARDLMRSAVGAPDSAEAPR